MSFLPFALAAEPQRENWVTNDLDGWTRKVTVAASQSQDMSDKQLVQLAKQLGKEWKRVAIYLDLDTIIILTNNR